MHNRRRIRPVLTVLLTFLFTGLIGTACESSDAGREPTETEDGVTLDPAVTVPEPAPGAVPSPEVWVVDADTDQLVALDPALAGVVRMVDTGGAVLDYTVTPDSVWVATAGPVPFQRVPRPAGRPVPVVLGGADPPRRLAVADGAVWVAGAEVSGTIRRFDTAAGTVTGEVALGDRIDFLAAGAGAVWATAGHVLFRIDAAGPALTGSVEIPVDAGEDLSGLVVEAGAVWVLADGVLFRVDPASLAHGDPVEVASGNSSVAAGDAAVWVTDTFRNDIHRIDAASGHVAATFRPVTKPVALAAGGGSLYVVHTGGLKLARLDPADGRFLAGVQSKVSLRAVSYG
ncbi:MAG: hypothetical protein IT198_04995 [Acidimicrobiia bacterium]|nr:hypothetical protein [Acidimicrobiia bacterium]